MRDIETYLVERNANPKPYKWKAKGAEILSKLKRARAARQSRGRMSYLTVIENRDTTVPVPALKWLSSLRLAQPRAGATVESASAAAAIAAEP